MYVLRMMPSPIDTNTKFTSTWQDCLTVQICTILKPYSHNSSRISAQMDAFPLGLYYIVSEEMRRLPYKVSDQVKFAMRK